MQAIKQMLLWAWSFVGLAVFMLMLFFPVMPISIKQAIWLLTPIRSFLIWCFVGLGLFVGLLHVFFPEPKEKSVASGAEPGAGRTEGETIYGSSYPSSYRPVDDYRGGPDNSGEYDDDDYDVFPGSSSEGFSGSEYGFDNDGGDADGDGDGD